MQENDPDRLAGELEHQVDELEQRSAELGSEVEETRQDWEHKRGDAGVPGAPPPEDGDSTPEAAETQDPPPEADRTAAGENADD